MRRWLVVVFLGLAAAWPAAAQQPPAAPQEPPARVGTVSIASGNLAFHAAGDTQWSAAGVNYPVATGGSFWTEPQARAQIQIGPTTIGMDGGTELDITNLDEQTAQLGVPQGRIHLHLRQLDTGQSFEIDLPQGAVRLLQPGSYDIAAGSPDQGARVAVFAGSARFVGGGADLGIRSGEAAVLSHTNPITVSTERAGSDAFVEWCSTHDYHEDHLAAASYVSPHMTGYSDLDRYGNWQSNPQYGEVWYPSQTPADWAPYRDGRWVSVPPWGWTWVDQQPWGFAPFHYGRWAYVGDRWGWVPGSYVARPVYAPALVAFVGLGAGIGAAIGGGGPAVGWFPLAPGEPYWPSYTRNTAYIRNVNISNVRNINTVIGQSRGAPSQQANANFANRRFATVVPQRVFANADPVAPAVVHVPPAALQKAPVAVHPPQITPVVAHAPAAGPPRAPPNAAALGPTRGQPGQPPRPGQPAPPGTAQERPAAPGARPANTAALPPPRPGEVRPAEPARPGQMPPPAGAGRDHGAAPAEARPEHPASPGGPAAAARPANTAALPPHPGASPAARPERAATPSTAALPPHPGPAAPPHEGRPERAATPSTAALPPHPGPAAPPHEAHPERAPPPAAGPERRPPPAAATHPAPPPRPATPPAQAQIARPPAPQPHPAAPVHPAAAAPHPAPPPHPPAAVHPAAAAPHPAAAAHPQPGPAHGGKPAPKEGGKGEERHP
jgi:hypothetical protein